jgi:3-(3-hydroxy-phenyl)propionate hydroxylase
VAVVDTDVLIVGAGPTGLTLASILGMHGVRTVLAERNAATVGEPRAVSIDDESLRTMQYIGLVDGVRAKTFPYGSYYFSPGGHCFAKVIPTTLEYGHPRRSAFRQPVLEAQLREGLRRFPSVDARFSCEVDGVEDRGDHVRARIGGEEMRARYVAACDGARSGIREALGIGMGGSTYDQKWLIVDLTGSTDTFGHTRVFADPARPGLALPGPDRTRRYEFMVLPGEDPEALLEESRVRALLARHSEEDPRLPIVRKVVYQFHARIADRWRAGRIFLAGDAAHLSPPFAGQGMNSGIRDAHNLGWKLALALRGVVGEAVLDTYEAERKPHAAALIQMAVRMGHVMMPRSPLKGFATRALFRALSLYPPARDYVMQMKYKPKPHYGGGWVVGEAGPGLRGRMFPQPTVEKDGAPVLLDELLGRDFAVLEIEGEMIAIDGETHVRDASGAIRGVLDTAGVRGVILRPDRYVAACIARESGPGEAARLLAELTRPSR